MPAPGLAPAAGAAAFGSAPAAGALPSAAGAAPGAAGAAVPSAATAAAATGASTTTSATGSTQETTGWPFRSRKSTPGMGLSSESLIVSPTLSWLTSTSITVGRSLGRQRIRSRWVLISSTPLWFLTPKDSPTTETGTRISNFSSALTSCRSTWR